MIELLCIIDPIVVASISIIPEAFLLHWLDIVSLISVKIYLNKTDKHEEYRHRDGLHATWIKPNGLLQPYFLLFERKCAFSCSFYKIDESIFGEIA